MQIITISPRGFGANSYIITEDGKRAVVIDPAQPQVADELARRGLQAQQLLLTHCHFDHVGGVAALQKMGAKVLCFEKEKPLVNTDADLFDLFGERRAPYVVDDTFFDGEEKNLCGISVKAIWTPGHTIGSCCYLITAKDGGRYLFTGDTLFAGCIGRTDFPTGDLAQMRQSLRKLKEMDSSLPIYPGHEENTTLQKEQQTNPFLLDA